MRKTVLVGFVLMIFFESNMLAQTALPCDKQATQETINLYNNLKKSFR